MKMKEDKNTGQVSLKHKVLEAFWKELGEKHAQSKNPDNCEWCERFKPLNFRVCMNCGTTLGGEGFFGSEN